MADSRVDLTRVDGPHSPQRTAAAARLIPDAIRFLNYATMPANGAPGIGCAGDVDTVLSQLEAAANGLQQTLAQLSNCLQVEEQTGRLRLDRGRPHADDPEAAVHVVAEELKRAAAACWTLHESLKQARHLTGGMYRAERTNVG